MRRSPWLGVVAVATLAGLAPAARAAVRPEVWQRGVAVVGYRSPAALERALARHPATLLRLIPALHAAEVRPRQPVAAFAAALRGDAGVEYVEPIAPRKSHVEPALQPAPAGTPEWQWAATHEDAVSQAVSQAAAGITIAVVDTGADVTAPDLAAKTPSTYSVVTDSVDVPDANGHGTFVAALAAGSPSNGDGVSGFGGEARLLVVQAATPDGSFSDVDEAAGIVYAVDHGAKIVNLSLGGPDTSRTERSAIDYAARHGVLLVAAAGNEGDDGNPVEYPAALLQPVGSNGVGGVGLAVAATTQTGDRAAFSNTGSWVSLAAPGDDVLSAVSSASSATNYPRAAVTGTRAGLYGYASGTSFAAPEVAGAAALVWAAQPSLSAAQVAQILKESANGGGAWNPETGYGVVDVAAAVTRAASVEPNVLLSGKRSGRQVQLAWQGAGAESYRVTVSEDAGPQRVLLDGTTDTSTSYAVLPGHLYSFTVAAVDGAGAPQAVSQPYLVRYQPATARLGLAAARTRGQLVLTAQLRPAVASVPATSRTVILESFDGTRWRRAAVGVTLRTGRVSWTMPLARGAYRVRARFAGADDVAPALSAPLTVRVA